MPRPALLLAVLALAAVAAADRLTWAGCNTNFNNVMNWASNQTLPFDLDETDTPPQSVYLAREDASAYSPVNTQLAVGEIKMHELVFGPNVVATFSSSGTELVFLSEDDTEGKAFFIAGQPERMKDDACNFKCHKAWKLGYGTPSEREAQNPPCDDDTAVFPPENTYRVLAQGVINVKGLEMEGAPLESKDDVPEYQMTPAGEALKLYINDNSNCFASGLVKDDHCLCHSQCADEERHRAQDAELRDLARDVAEDGLEDLKAAEDRAFTVTFLLADVLADAGSSLDAATAAQCVFNKHAARLQQTLADAVEAGLPGAVLRDFDVRMELNSGVVLVTAQSSNISVPTSLLYIVDGDGSLTNQEWWASTVVAQTEPVGPNMLSVHLWQALAASLASCQLWSEDLKVDAKMGECVAALGEPTCVALSKLVQAAIAAAGRDAPYNGGPVTTLLNEIDAYMLNPPMSVNPLTGEATPRPFEPTLAGFAQDTGLDLEGAAQTLLAKRVAGATRGMLQTQAQAMGLVLADRESELYAAEDNLPPSRLVRTDLTTSMVVGRRLPQSDVNRLTDERNKAPLAAWIASQLPGAGPVLAVDAAATTFGLYREAGRRRRAATAPASDDTDINTSGQAHTPLAVGLPYTMLVSSACEAGDVSAVCPLVADTSVYLQVQAALDDIVSAYQIVTAKCYNLETGNDLQCAIDEAVKVALSQPNLTPEQREELIRQVLQDALDCPSGDCSADEEQMASLNAAITSASKEAMDKVAAASGEDKAAGVPIAAVAGAAAGVVLLIIIVLVAMRRRKRRDPKAASGERTVVAFENPMYDDPAQAPAQAIYDDATPGGEDAHNEGLYDEPAFAQDKFNKDKENPMYQSTEDILAPGEEEEAGGYLDVAPDEELEDDE